MDNQTLANFDPKAAMKLSVEAMSKRQPSQKSQKDYKQKEISNRKRCMIIELPQLESSESKT